MLFSKEAYTQTSLSDADKVLSNRFKSLNGSNRESLFSDSLYRLVRVVNSSNNDTTTSNLMSSKISSRDDVRMLLGNPDFTTPDFIDEWSLLASPSNKRLVVVYNRNYKVINWAIKN